MEIKIQIISILFTLFQFCSSYKIAIFTSDFSGSQLIFNKKVAETLAKAGHDVVIYRIRSMGFKNVEVHMDQKLIKVSDIIAYSEDDFEAFNQELGEVFFNEFSFFDAKTRNIHQKFMDMLVNSCSEILRMKSLIFSIKNERFDLAFGSSYDYCSVGLIYESGIPTWIWLNSGPLADTVAHDIGVSSPPSYVPLVWADSGDEMGFTKRFMNLVLRSLMPIYTAKYLSGPETELFRKFIKSDFPDLRDLAQNCPLVMVDSDDLYDFPRPTLGKVINIGGLGLTKKNFNLEEKLKIKLEKFDFGIIFSLGAVTNSSMMTPEWKNALLETFSSFPKTLFFFRYVDEDLDEKIGNNVFISKWLPQFDLLNHPKIKILISNCGYSSLQEAIYSSKPIIGIPLFGDQKRNSKIIEKHEIGLVISKSHMTFEKLSSSIRILLLEKKFLQNIQKLNKKVLNQPFSPEEKLLKWTEFLAENKDLSQMNPSGNYLSFVEYHNLDVFWTLGFFFFFIIWILFKISGCFISCFDKPITSEKKNN